MGGHGQLKRSLNEWRVVKSRTKRVIKKHLEFLTGQFVMLFEFLNILWNNYVLSKTDIIYYQISIVEALVIIDFTIINLISEHKQR